MKKTHVLRVYFTRHKLADTRYRTTKEHRDFDSAINPLKAYRLMLEEHGSILDSDKEVEFFQDQRIKIAPDQYITIHSHSIVEAEPERVRLESERRFEQDLFSPEELRKTLQDSPRLKEKQRKGPF